MQSYHDEFISSYKLAPQGYVSWQVFLQKKFHIYANFYIKILNHSKKGKTMQAEITKSLVQQSDMDDGLNEKWGAQIQSFIKLNKACK